MPELFIRGECSTCGSVTLRSGEWTKVSLRGEDTYIRVRRGDQPDWALGNGLTYYDLTADTLGNTRFHRQEGYHSSLASKFAFNVEERWLRSRTQADYDAAVIGVLLHALAMRTRESGNERLVGGRRSAVAA